jgi:hypothetical protein
MRVLCIQSGVSWRRNYILGWKPAISQRARANDWGPSAFHKVNPGGELRFWTILQFPAFYSLGELEPYLELLEHEAGRTGRNDGAGGHWIALLALAIVLVSPEAIWTARAISIVGLWLILHNPRGP